MSTYKSKLCKGNVYKGILASTFLRKIICILGTYEHVQKFSWQQLTSLWNHGNLPHKKITIRSYLKWMVHTQECFSSLNQQTSTKLQKLPFTLALSQRFPKHTGNSHHLFLNTHWKAIVLVKTIVIPLTISRFMQNLIRN